MRLAAVVVVIGALVMASVGSTQAQTKIGAFAVEGEIEAGVRGVFGVKDNERGKLEEYRDLPSGMFLPALRLGLIQPDGTYGAELLGSKWGQQDQEFSLLAGRLGLWQFRFDWDQTPHLYSTTARTLANEVARGIWRLPSPRPALSTHNSAPRIDDGVGQRWDTSRVDLTWSVTPELDLNLLWTRINKDGERPMSLSFGSPGNGFYEVPGPIEHTINDIRISGALQREQWQLQAAYTASFFRNSVRALVVDNPCFGATSGCGDAGAPTGGQLSLDPDNQAHSFTLAGGVNLPLRTRVNASFGYQLRLQNDSFLPHTIAPIASNALVLPQRSLHGLVQTFLGNVNLTSRPLPWPVTFSARYRIYDFVDESDQIYFPGHVVSDRTLAVETRRVVRSPYTRQNADLDARWRITMPLSVTIGTGWERWDRDDNSREVPVSDEFFGKGKIDWSPLDWLTVSGSYRPAFRRIPNYDTFARISHTTEEEAGAVTSSTQSTKLRKHDQGERDRQQFDLSLTFAPTDTLTTTLTTGWKYDDYIQSTFGLQKDITWSAGLDVSWNPVERFTMYGGYVHESIAQRQRSRSRESAGGIFDRGDFDWVTEHNDMIDTFHLGVRATLIPKRLDWNFTGAYSYALGRSNTFNPVQPTSGSAAQNANATARPFPALENSLLRLETQLKYLFGKNWFTTFGYVLEAFEKTDWRTDTINPFVPGTVGVFLGNDYRDYTAHIVGLTLGYRFGK
jgi:MtrB/PioB family decaheme-associated outer membrane protein